VANRCKRCEASINASKFKQAARGTPLTAASFARANGIDPRKLRRTLRQQRAAYATP
jgi:hypothetical protein